MCYFVVAVVKMLRVVRLVGRSHCLLGDWGILKQRLAGGGRWAESDLLTGSLNKVLLEHSCTIHLCIIYACFYATTTELSSLSRDCMACKPDIFTIQPFIEKVCLGILWRSSG